MNERPRVVIVGGGFAGLQAARSLYDTAVDILLIDKQNHHLFQPLLYQVATAALSPADIAWPIRRILRWQKNVEVLMGEVTDIDCTRKAVLLGSRAERYDYLVLAVGATHSYFGHDEWAPYAPGLKEIADATQIRRQLLLALERAEASSDTSERARLLTFVVVGGGPTGVEMAGSMAEVAKTALVADFRHADLRKTRVVLVEAGTRLLSSFPESLSDYAERALTKLGVEVRLETTVTGCDENGVQLGSNRIEASTIIWAAGVAAFPAARWLGVTPDRAGRVKVDERLAVADREAVFAVGDVSFCSDASGQPLPGIAPVAKQQGAYVGRLIKARVERRGEPPIFRYRASGQLATIGRRAAVVDFGRVRLKGQLAWWFWGIVHIYFLISARSRLLVSIQWLWSYLTFDRGARLITSD